LLRAESLIYNDYRISLISVIELHYFLKHQSFKCQALTAKINK
jgi:hypothetical protein